MDGAVAKTVAAARVSPDAEWLLTDGLGGYGCGTAAGLAMRRYHGLWVARPEGIAGRRMIVAGLDERIGPAPTIADVGERPSAHVMPAHWRDLPNPSAGQGSMSFCRRPLPTWTYETEFGVVERSIALRKDADGGAALLVRWRNRSPHAVRVDVRALLGWCNVDHLPPASDAPPEQGGFDGTVHARGASWGFRPTSELPHLWLSVDGVSAFRGDPAWYRGFLYGSDRLRGYDHVGDRWSPGVLELDLAADGGEATAAFALEDPCVDAALAFDAIEAAESQRWRATQASEHARVARLALGAEDFLYRGVGGRLGVLAGFPWFGEWGRDVFLALPGLTLALGRTQQCVEVMTGCLQFLREGLLPNIYGKDIASSNYGSCDAALWFALAAMRFVDGGHGREAKHAALVAEQLIPALRSIAAAYEQGTRLGLKVQEDGLLQAGSKELNATWMDARTSKGPVTPREGLPVEIQAVWYALLAFLAEQEGADANAGSVNAGSANAGPVNAAHYAALRDRCGKSFLKAFWLTDQKTLADRVHDGRPDRSIRPNMLVAAALSRSPLSAVQRQGVVKVAKAHLVTPCGIRTLSQQDEKYIGIYGGGLEGRDNAYHQGTVWPWPAGFFVEAALRAASKKSRRQEAETWSQWLEQLLAVELDRAGLDHVSEVFDGDAPHRPGGTFAQAWNTGELLRAHVMCQQVLAGADLDGGNFSFAGSDAAAEAAQT